ncbi:unnamed protein product [Merluccius merluccius]
MASKVSVDEVTVDRQSNGDDYELNDYETMSSPSTDRDRGLTPLQRNAIVAELDLAMYARHAFTPQHKYALRVFLAWDAAAAAAAEEAAAA